MPKLTDTQLIVLSAASQRPTLNLLPLPNHLKGGAIPKVLHVLLAGGLVAEVDAEVAAVDGGPVWRRGEDGRETRLILTQAGFLALGIEPEASASAAPQATDPANGSKAAPEATKSLEARPVSQVTARPRKTREGTKQATLIAMLKAPAGATLAEIVDATGWQSHTVRGALSGALKKKLGLEVTSVKEDGRGRVYRIAD